jgi:large subunit ribosomal protein L10
MPTQAKAAVIEEITERFQNSSAAVLTEYRGLTVAQLTQLRVSLGAGSSYAVVKNTLTKRAADAVGHSDLAPLLTGPTAIAFIDGDPVEAAKAIRDFAKANPLLVVKGAGLFQAPLSQVARLAAALQEKKEAAGETLPAAEAPAADDASTDDVTAAADTTPDTTDAAADTAVSTD